MKNVRCRAGMPGGYECEGGGQKGVRWPAISAFLFYLLVLMPLTSLAAQSAAAQKPIIAVSILPQSEFAQKLAGSTASVITLVGPGASPHNYEPTPRQMSELGKASMWFTVGVEFENALLPKVKALYPKLKIIDTTKGIIYRDLESHHHEGEAEHDEEAGGKDPHVWLGHDAVKAQLAVMLEALTALNPAGKDQYKKNHDSYVQAIDAAFSRLKNDLAPLKGQTVFVYHPSFGYFFDEFGIIQEAVEAGGKEPSQKALAELIKKAQDDKVKVIFVQKQFSANAAKTVAKAIGGSVVEIDPLAENWLENILIMGNALKKAAR